jgi:MoxR-like ATPase
MKLSFNPDLERIHDLPPVESWPATVHQFTAESVWAVRTALAARRPLLVRGEPGIGKSQLARAAAAVLEVPFLSQVINSRCECDDLLYHYDAVSRLAQAQVLGAADRTADWQAQLDPARFVRPGVLWWAFDWQSARQQAARFCGHCPEPAHPPKWSPGQGCVVLIDEIDKADSDVPNGLLESLGNTGFHVPPANRSVALDKNAVPPLVIVTTNEERELPAAFLRRCLVLQMPFPTGDAAQTDFLLRRAQVHTPAGAVSDPTYREAARQLLQDRQKARQLGQAKPGAAEFLDLIRALAELHPGDESAQRAALNQIAGFALHKYPDEAQT